MLQEWLVSWVCSEQRERGASAPIGLVPILVERVADARMVRGDPVGRGEDVVVFEERVNVAEDSHVAVEENDALRGERGELEESEGVRLACAPRTPRAQTPAACSTCL